MIRTPPLKLKHMAILMHDLCTHWDYYKEQCARVDNWFVLSGRK